MEGVGYFISQTQLDSLLNAKDQEEFLELLSQTFLGAHMEGEGGKKNINYALEASLSETKNIINGMAPNPEEFDILWYKYDFSNLKVILKGVYKGISEDEILKECNVNSKHDPRLLLEAVKKDKVEFMPKEVSLAIEASRNLSAGIHMIDLHVDKGYIDLIKRLAEDSAHPFLKKYVYLYSRFLDIKNQLRMKNLDGFVEVSGVFVSDTGVDKALESLKGMGDERFWEDAIAEYESEGHFTLLEKKMDDYLLDTLKHESIADIFSPATLFAFCEARKNDINIIRSLYVFKTTKRNVDYIKKYLRNSFIYVR